MTSLHPLKKEQIIQTLQDKTITTIPWVIMNDAALSSAFSAYLNNNGQIIGKLTAPPANEPETDQGTWEVKENGILCCKWQHWLQQKPDCVFMYDLKNSFLFINAESGIFDTVIFKDQIKVGNHMGIHCD